MRSGHSSVSCTRDAFLPYPVRRFFYASFFEDVKRKSLTVNRKEVPASSSRLTNNV
jgi:hypothetical protein